MRLIEKPEDAMRLARTSASDILLYNKEKIAEGIKDDNLFEILEEQIKEATKHFEERVSPALREQYNFLERAIVDVLIQRSAALPTTIW